jgi:hypothetical protein
MSPDDPRHGTHAGWSAHAAQKEKCCPDCSEFRRHYMRDRRRMRASGRLFTFPLEVARSIADLDGLGTTIARAMRESA